jgi:hypothetical protein
MNERPAAVENCGAERLRDIQRSQRSCAERRHKQDELKVRHVGAMDIKCLHVFFSALLSDLQQGLPAEG